MKDQFRQTGPNVVRWMGVRLRMLSRFLYASAVDVPAWDEDHPWASPNIWNRIVAFYSGRPQPVVFEYGTGVSTLHHIKNLLGSGGAYVGVEHEACVYLQAISEIYSFSLRNRHQLTCSFSSGEDGVVLPVRSDIEFSITAANGAACAVRLKYRARDMSHPESRWKTYVHALDEPCDVIIVDGRVRKDCVNHVIDSGFLKPGGMLALFEAWRGTEGWQGRPKLVGKSDYQPEVRRMLGLGGELADGDGLDGWPGLKKKRGTRSTSHSYPAEACFLLRRGW